MTKILILIGTNPIPCYISALYLLDYYHSEIELFLVCSQEDPKINQAGTYIAGERIGEKICVLFPDLKITLKEISDVASKPAIDRALQGCYHESDEVHLNYTGGTKSMAAIAFNILKDHPSFSSSYLDGRRHIMIMDGVPDNSIDLRGLEILKLDLKSIIKLHGLDQFEKKPLKNSYRDLMEQLRMLMDEKRILDICCTKNPKKYSKEKLDKEAEQVRFCREQLIKKSGIRDHETDEEHINKFIDGPWLEHYLYDELEKTEHDGVDIYPDVEKNNFCQVDLIAIYGYQMTLISVTTDTHLGMSKLKAFEAIHRAHQLGGDEAKTIMVTFMRDPATLENTIRGSFGSLVPGFKAFGINHFYDGSIFTEIINYIKE